ncbi:MAG TPA: DUF6265 family protein [Terriglobales bacterium]|nr:DUF6265 family protein [Terriglobales bacterium]
MKSPGYAAVVVLCICSLSLHAQSSPQPAAPSSPAAATEAASSPAIAGKDAKVSDLAFLSGHWSGEVDGSKIEQECSTTDPSVMVCMFRLMSEKGTQMLEFYTLRDTPSGVEERIRFFSPDLQEEPGDKGVTLKLASVSAEKAVFENPTGTYPKRTTILRKGNDEFNSHIELVDAQGKESTIDAHWGRTR